MSYTHIIERLNKGEEVTINASGTSMEPRIKNKSKVTLIPVDTATVKVGDVVLAKVHGRYYTHLVTQATNEKVMISNNHGHDNGWTNRNKIYGIVKE